MRNFLIALGNTWLKIKRYFKSGGNEVIFDLLENGHDFCDNCGEIFFKTKPKHRFCSNACRYKYHAKKR